MEVLAQGYFHWYHYLVTFVFVTVCLLLIIIILLQKGRGGGLSGAFGGVGGHSAFGAKTGDVFTWVTVGLAGMFLLVAIIGNFVFVMPASSEAVGQSAPAGDSTEATTGNVPADVPNDAPAPAKPPAETPAPTSSTS